MLSAIERDFVADDLAAERAADGRLKRDDVRAMMVLVLAQDPVRRGPFVALERDLGAGADHALRQLDVLHEARPRQS